MSGCDHGMPSPGSCLDCMDEGMLPPPPPPKKPKAIGYRIPARYPGHCRGCNLPITVNQFIRAVSDGSGYVHDGCEP